MAKAIGEIILFGKKVDVLNTYSCGPGMKPHTFVLRGQRELSEIAGVWMLEGGGIGEWNPRFQIYCVVAADFEPESYVRYER